MPESDLKPLIARFRTLSTANVSDGLDRLGLSGTPHRIGPLWEGCGRIVGPAATIKLVSMEEAEESATYGTLKAIKAANPGDVLVIDHGGEMHVNSYGGIAGFTTRQFGLVGCVIDGVTRDIDEFKQLNLPVYARGFIQQSIRNRCAMAGHGIDVELGGGQVSPRDLIVADENGVCVVPYAHAEDVLENAERFKAIEEAVVEEIRMGADPVEAHTRISYDKMTESGA